MQSNYSRRIEGKEVKVNGKSYIIYPFGAFTATNLSGEITGAIMPVIGVLAPLFDNKKLSLDDDIVKAAPMLSSAFSVLSGDKLESLMKKLLCSKNIVLKESDEYLTEEMADEIFCAEIMGMYQLAFYVLKENFGGFFGKLVSLSGKVMDEEAPKTLNNMASLI